MFMNWRCGLDTPICSATVAGRSFYRNADVSRLIRETLCKTASIGCAADQLQEEGHISESVSYNPGPRVLKPLANEREC